MRCLGYPRLVSADNFRTPNFDLVAELLFWMVDKYDPSAAVPDDISTEDMRVDFLTSVAQVMWSKANVKLNTKRLYSADGKAVKELIKIAEILYRALDAAESPEDPLPQEMASVQAFTDSKSTRALASQITEQGARLYDLLDDEKSLGSERQDALRFLETISKNLNSNAEYQLVESRLEEAIAAASEEASSLQRQCEELESDKKTLRLKIQKKQGELERNDKRLKSLQSVRPAFMDEYERLEGQLEAYYDIYLQNFRNLDYLQTQLELYNKRERLKLEENEKTKRKIQRSIMEDNQRSLKPVRIQLFFYASLTAGPLGGRVVLHPRRSTSTGTRPATRRI